MVAVQPRPYRRVMAGAPPTSRLARTGRFGGLVAGQGLRWATTQAANRVRSPERAEAATGERAAGLARELVNQLGHMRGAAMKIGQVLSTVDFTAIPPAEREEFKRTLAALRDDVPPLPFPKIERLLKTELGGSLSASFHRVRRGGVRRRLDRPGPPRGHARRRRGRREDPVPRHGRGRGDRPAQPRTAAAAGQRLAPALDVKALAAEVRERLGEELDYEIEAQNHRSMARAWRDHPFAHVPAVYTSLSSRRVLVTEPLVRPPLRGGQAAPRTPSATASPRSSSGSSSAR